MEEDSERTDRLIAVLAYIMARYPGDALAPGFDFQRLRLTEAANAEDRARHAQIVKHASDILSGKKVPDEPLPERIAFLKLKSDGKPDASSDGALAPWTQGMQAEYVFKSRTDETKFGLFEAPASTTSDGPRVATYLTQRVQAVDPYIVPKRCAVSGFAALIFGLLLFCYSVADTIASGKTIARAQSKVHLAMSGGNDGPLIVKVRGVCAARTYNTSASKTAAINKDDGLCSGGKLAVDQTGTQETRFASCLPKIA